MEISEAAMLAGIRVAFIVLKNVRKTQKILAINMG
jgi:hypothetical protein